MKNTQATKLWVVVLLCGLWVPVTAQSNSADQPEWLLYGFAAPGTTSLPASRKGKSGKHTDVAIGGGVDKFAGRYFSFGGEAAITPYEREQPQRTVAFEPPVLWIQFNGTYHLHVGRATQHFVPFASVGVGITSFAGSGANEGWNYGAGFHLWAAKRWGARIEYRKIIEPIGDYSGGSFRTVRIGLAFR